KLFPKSFERRRLFRSKGGTQKLFLFSINDVFSNTLLGLLREWPPWTCLRTPPDVPHAKVSFLTYLQVGRLWAWSTVLAAS
ncbi:hypothetical protein, partial [Novacetimonas hansenii]|uniref:hypothetical protein n=1 Tax=Novacetimonas hansenii TaxID=436 RepID=UPI001C4ACDF5